MTSIVLAVAASEAQVNQWGNELGGWSEAEDRLFLLKKCERLAVRRAVPIDLSRGSFQELQWAVGHRNRYLHSTPLAQPLKVTGSGTVLPGTISVEARRACLAVRVAFVDLARCLGFEPPRYLAYCPAADPDDEAAWSAASAKTGTRADPDFPRV